MKWFSFSGLRVRMIFLVLIAIVPALGITLYKGLEERKLAGFRAMDYAMNFAQEISKDQDRLIQNTRQILFAISRTPQVLDHDIAGCTRIFADLMKETEGYTTFLAVKPNGDVFASNRPLERPVNLSDRPYFQRLLKTRGFVVGEYQIGRISGKAIIALAYPALDEKGNLRTILTTGLDLEWIGKALAGHKLPEGTSVSVLDKKGTVLFRNPEPEKFVGKSTSESPIFRKILEKREGSVEELGLDGVLRLFGFCSLGQGEESVHVSVGIPKETALADVYHMMRWNLTFLGLIGALALAVAWFGGNLFILRPVNRLIDVTNRLSEGALNARSGPSYERGEIGQLARAFDGMADSLERREAERNRAEEELRRHRDHLEDMVEERSGELKRTNERLEKEVAEHKRTEQAFRVSEERFRIAVENVSDLIWEWDIVKGELAWFGKLDEMLGYGPGEFQRTLEAWEKVIHPDDHDRVMTILDQHLKTRKPYLEEYRVFKKDGSIRYWSDSGTALWDEQGKAYKMIGAVSDITERKRAEEALEKQARKLARSNAELEQFAYVASHDLQEPLRIISSYLQLLERKYKDSLDEEARRYITRSVEGSARMRTLINDLLSYSRVGTKGKSFESTNCEVVLQDVLANLRIAIEGNGVVVTSDPLPRVMADPTQLAQLFQNLIGNALKFRREESPRVHISAQKNENEWIFSVQDNGIGIESQYADRIFGVFQRLHTRSEYPGTGIGLAICKKIIDRHEGRIWVDSEPGKGSTFCFTIPDKGGLKNE